MAYFSSGLFGSVTITMWFLGSNAWFLNACSKDRKALSVSTVEPDFDETTTVVFSSSTSVDSTWLGSVESKTVSSVSCVLHITSGAREDPPIPASTILVFPSAWVCLQNSVSSCISGSVFCGESVHPSLIDASLSASFPQIV